MHTHCIDESNNAIYTKNNKIKQNKSRLQQCTRTGLILWLYLYALFGVNLVCFPDFDVFFRSQFFFLSRGISHHRKQKFPGKERKIREIWDHRKSIWRKILRVWALKEVIFKKIAEKREIFRKTIHFELITFCLYRSYRSAFKMWWVIFAMCQCRIYQFHCVESFFAVISPHVICVPNLCSICVHINIALIVIVMCNNRTAYMNVVHTFELFGLSQSNDICHTVTGRIRTSVINRMWTCCHKKWEWWVMSIEAENRTWSSSFTVDKISLFCADCHQISNKIINFGEVESCYVYRGDRAGQIYR